MDEKHFKKHLHDLAHGHHHPEEHDWGTAGAGTAKARVKKKAAKPAARKRKTRAK
jgi:hypothetical protein